MNHSAYPPSSFSKRLCRGFSKAGEVFLRAGISLLCLGGRLRQVCYRWGILSVHSAGAPVISVGGLTWGGAGKTPVTGWFLDAAHGAGEKAGLVSRGYRRSSRGLQLWRAKDATWPANTHTDWSQIGELPARFGDEVAMMVARHRPWAAVVVANRHQGALALVKAGCSHIVMDDGFGHQRLHRDLNVLVWPAELFDTDFLETKPPKTMPPGVFRESKSSVERADVLWVHARRGKMCPQAVKRAQIWAAGFGKVFVCSKMGMDAPRNHAGEKLSAEATMLAATGIAQGHKVVAGWRSVLQLNCVEHIAFADHHPFDANDVAMIEQRCLDVEAAAVVVTEKDAVKLAPIWSDLKTLYWIPTHVDIWVGQKELDAILGRLNESREV